MTRPHAKYIRPCRRAMKTDGSGSLLWSSIQGPLEGHVWRCGIRWAGGARGKALDGDWAVPELRVSRTRAGAVNAALVSYYQSSAFRDGLAQSSQQMRRAILECFREEHGDK